MELNRFLSVIALILSCVNGVPLLAVVKIAGLAFSVLELGINILKFTDISGKNGKNSDEIVGTLNARIDAASTSSVIANVLLQSKLERVDDTVINIHSSLIDIRNVIRANDTIEKEENIKLFVNRFNEHDLIKHIRFLPELLEYNIPGTSGKLVDLFAVNTRCNMTAIYEFKHFYCKLLSDGIALHLLHLRFTANLSLSKRLEDWQHEVTKVTRIFENLEDSCVQNFAEYAQEDVQSADDALVLWTNSNNRYPSLTNDVIFLKKFGTFQLLYYQYVKSGDNMFVHRSDKKTKIAIFTDKHEPRQLSSFPTDAKEMFRSAIQGKTDQNAAKNVGHAVENYLQQVGYYLKALIVFFDDREDLSPLKVKFDENSTVLQCTLEDVQLRCDLQCRDDVQQWFDWTKMSMGRMEIFAYVGAEEHELYEIGLGMKNGPVTTLHYLLIWLGVVLFHRVYFE